MHPPSSTAALAHPSPEPALTGSQVGKWRLVEVNRLIVQGEMNLVMSPVAPNINIFWNYFLFFFLISLFFVCKNIILEEGFRICAYK